jgi:hypothetical protein
MSCFTTKKMKTVTSCEDFRVLSTHGLSQRLSVGGKTTGALVHDEGECFEQRLNFFNLNQFRDGRRNLKFGMVTAK